MRQALLIFRKDARHLWPQLVIYWAMLAGYACLSVAVPNHVNLVYFAASPTFLLMAACLYLTGVLVHADAPEGNRQFWITRPFDWRSVLAAKALFALAFLVVPVLVSHTITLAALGLFATPSLVAAVSKAGGLISLLSFAFVVAALTRNVGQLFLFVLAASIGGIALLYGVVARTYENLFWGSVVWMRDGVNSLLLLLGAAVLLALAYKRHMTNLCRALFAGMFLLVPAMQCLNWWHVAWDIQALLYGDKATVPPVSIVFDENAPAPAKGNWYYYSRDDVVGVKFPVQARGIPEGMRLVGERLRTQVDAPGGRQWDSGWRVVGGIGAMNGAVHLVRQDGPDLLATTIDTPFFDEVKNVPVHVRVTMTFAVLGKPETARVNAGGPPQRTSSGSLCSLPSNADPSVWCFSTEGDQVRREVYWEPWEDPRDNGFNITPVGAFQAFGTLQYRREATPSTRSTGSFATLLSRHVENYIETTLDIPRLVLRPHEVGRSGGLRRSMETIRIEP